jgi:flagellar motor switch protein FliN/FliY
MASDLQTLLKLEVPVIVRLGERTLTVAEVVDLVPGAIIELPKRAEDELDLLVNNKQIGTGTAVKVGENFGLRISFIGDARARIAALGGSGSSHPTPATPVALGDPSLV